MFTSHFSKLFTGRGYDNEFQILFLRIFLAIKTKLFVDVAVIKIIISYEIRKKIVKTNLGIRCRILSTAFYVTRNAKLRRKRLAFIIYNSSYKNDLVKKPAAAKEMITMKVYRT